MSSRKDVDDWLGKYVEAWKTYDRHAIGDLFTENAEYRFHPYDEPLVGRDAIVEGWLEEPDVAGTYDGSYRTIAVDGPVAVATGTSLYRASPSDTAIDRVYENCFVMEFDDDGRCRRFTEWYMKRP